MPSELAKIVHIPEIFLFGEGRFDGSIPSELGKVFKTLSIVPFGDSPLLSYNPESVVLLSAFKALLFGGGR